jgi:hypothetical protein
MIHQRPKLQPPDKADRQISGTRSGPSNTVFHRRWNALGRYLIWHADKKAPLPPLALGLPPAARLIEEILDGDLTLGNIGSNCKVELESRRGNVIVEQEIQEWVDATLKAHRAVTIGEGVGQYSIVRIIAGAEVLLGESVKRSAPVTLPAEAGEVGLDSKAGTFSGDNSELSTTLGINRDVGRNATVIITAVGDIAIDGHINQHAIADIISLDGAIFLRRMLKSHVTALLTAGRTVYIGESVDNHAQVTILAKGDVIIGQNIDRKSVANITSIEGSITIGQGIGDGATATLIARNGSINIGGSVERGSTVDWDARQFSCAHEDGTVNRIPRA